MILRWINAILAGQPMQVIGTVSFALILLLAGIDQITGYELSISVFYLIPIWLGAWYGSPRLGYIVSGCSAGTWMVVESGAALLYSQEWIHAWNAVVRLLAFIVVAFLLAELKEQLERHQQLARTDNLTGLLNRAGFFERAKLAIVTASRYGTSIAIAYIDLDGFKNINDTLGHLQGDAALKAVADVLGGYSRESDVVARIGGDEFVVLLPNTNVSGAHAYFEKLHSELRQKMIEQGWSCLDLSIGAVVFEKAPEDIGYALRLADTLMYRAKRSQASAVIVEGAGSPALALRSASVDV